MYKNQLQELAQRSCFNLPWYTYVREGPDHAPRFKAVVNFNGESFESPQYCSTLRQAEHSAAEAALASLTSRHSLAARILDETGVYKNLLHEIAQRVGSPLPQYTTYRSGSGHYHVLTGTVELAGITFTGDTAKNKKQAEKNAALAAWLSLKQLARQDASSSSEQENNEEQEQIRIARALQNYCSKKKLETMNPNKISLPLQKKFSVPSPRASNPQYRPTLSSSKILPLSFNQKTLLLNRPSSSLINDSHSKDVQKFSVIKTAPYVPIRQYGAPYQRIAPPVTLRASVPVFSAPPRLLPSQVMRGPPVRMAPPVSIRHSGPKNNPTPRVYDPVKKFLPEDDEPVNDDDESIAIKCLEQLEL